MRAFLPLALVAVVLGLSLAPARAEPGAARPKPPQAAAPGEEDRALRGVEMLRPERYTGDLDRLLGKGAIRVLTVHSKTDFFLDRGTARGISCELMQQFEAWLKKKLGSKQRLAFHYVPVPRDQLLPALVAGRGDIAAANLTVTPERLALVDFSDPVIEGVHEVVVTGPASPGLESLDDLAGQEVLVRKSSSYFASLSALNEKLVAAGRRAILLGEADEHLEDEDLLEMLAAGLIPLVVVDDHKARLWAEVLPAIKVREDLALREGGDVAFAIRKNSPRLKKMLDGYVKTAKKGTALGNVILKRYLRSTRWVTKADAAAERRRFEGLVELFRRQGGRYGFDALMVAAQAYQESGLDHAKRSPAGAIGIMQVMPATAKDPNINIPDFEELEPNIEAGVKYMRFMLDVFFAGAKMDEFNKTMFAFASYNAGPARIAKLRRKAAQQGLDPNRWFNHVEQVAAREIGRETVRYVSNILKYYVVYKRLEEQRARKEQVLGTMAGP
jgi:membrane-bound lytic murein transglycosylase MltF